VWFAALFALLGNLTIWICVCYFSVIHAFPGVVPEPQSTNFWMSIFERGYLYFFSIPKILAYYSLYIQNDVMTFWIWTLISFNLCYAFFLKIFGGK